MRGRRGGLCRRSLRGDEEGCLRVGFDLVVEAGLSGGEVPRRMVGDVRMLINEAARIIHLIVYHDIEILLRRVLSNIRVRELLGVRHLRLLLFLFLFFLRLHFFTASASPTSLQMNGP